MVILAVCLPAAPVRAHGDTYETVGLYLQPGNDQMMLLSTTFGLLISRDGGATFGWVCSETIGYGGRYRPDYALTTGGDIYATTFEGLRVSRDQGCTWNTISDLAAHVSAEVEVGPQDEVWVATASPDLPNDVFVSTDGGQTFVSKNAQADGVYWKTLRVAPSDGQRIYLTGYKVAEVVGDGGLIPPQAYAYRSTDGGDTWEPLPLNDVELGAQAWFFLMGVAPDNPDVVFAQSIGVNDSVGDALYRSLDGGLTWQRVLDTAARIESFLFRRNGDVIAGTELDGVYTSKDGGTSWTRQPLPEMRCVAETGDNVLYSCGANWAPDFFAMGRSTDGVVWEEAFRLVDLKQAYSCPPGTWQYDECEAKLWPAQCELLGCNVADAGVEPDAAGPGVDNGGGGCCDAGSRPGPGSAVLILLVLWSLRRQFCPRPHIS